MAPINSSTKEQRQRAINGKGRRDRGSQRRWMKNVCSSQSTETLYPYQLKKVDQEGRAVHNINTQVQLLTIHFHSQFAPESRTPILPPPALTLVHPVSHGEVTEAAANLHIYCALGPNGVPNELVKYACQNEDITKWVAHLLNSAIKGNST